MPNPRLTIPEAVQLARQAAVLVEKLRPALRGYRYATAKGTIAANALTSLILDLASVAPAKPNPDLDELEGRTGLGLSDEKE